MCIRSNINICNNIFSFETSSIVILQKYVSHILIENYTLSGRVYKTGICTSTLSKPKISTITAAVFKLQYHYQHVFYKKYDFFNILVENCALARYKNIDIYSLHLQKSITSTKNLSLRIPLIHCQ